MKAIVNGRIVLKDGLCEGRALLFSDRIAGIVEPSALPGDVERIDASGGYVCPGLFDMHIHGYLGADASDGDLDGLKAMAEGLAGNGVTTFLPTTMTVSYDELRAAFEVIRRAKALSDMPDWRGARVSGVNVEGPFINPEKKGAQAAEHIRPGDAAFLKEYADIVRVFTIAPEMPCNMDCIREMADRTLVSLGHSAADADTAQAAFDAGARHVTHLFNAMLPLNHRAPGLAGAALNDDRVSCELIADGFHVDRRLFRTIARAKGDKLVLITDCTRAGGLPGGEYSLGGQPIFLNGIECRLKDGTIAGSVLKLNRAVRNLIEYAGLPVWSAVRAASLTPAERTGLDGEIGSLEAGKLADIMLCDAAFEVKETYIGGERVY